MKAKSEGIVEGPLVCGFKIKVVLPQLELINEVKRIGFFKDRESEIELRIGDTLVLYISTSVA
jgi:hypothetical protein